MTIADWISGPAPDKRPFGTPPTIGEIVTESGTRPYILAYRAHEIGMTLGVWRDTMDWLQKTSNEASNH